MKIMMRVFHITDSINEFTGGTSVHISSLASATAELKVGPVELATIDLPEYGRQLLPASPAVTVRSFPPKRPFLYGRSCGFNDYLRDVSRLSDAIFHLHRMWRLPLLSASRYAQEAGKPCIITPHGAINKFSLSVKAGRKKLFWLLLEKRRIGRASLLRATALAEAREMAQILPRVPIAVVPPGSDLPDLPGHRPEKEFKTALFLSRIIPAKGLVSLIKAWSMIRPREWRLVVAGFNENGHEEECRRAARELEVEDVVTFVGPALGENKWHRYRGADLFILPSLSENFGIAVAEALASGIPVITTKGAPWEDLVKRRCGWWVDIGVAPLVKAMQEAFELPPAELREMGLRGRALVEEKFTWEACARKMIALYEWVLGLGPMPETVVYPGEDSGQAALPGRAVESAATPALAVGDRPRAERG